MNPTLRVMAEVVAEVEADNERLREEVRSYTGQIKAAAQEARTTGLPVVVSFVVGGKPYRLRITPRPRRTLLQRLKSLLARR